jgi:nucleoredoxin
MRLCLLTVVLAFCLAVASQATGLPMTSNEVGLMLRMGYSSRTILEELARRRFSDTLDAAKEMQLIRAGASAELIGALRSGRYTVSPEEAARAEQERKERTSQRAAEAEESRHSDTLFQEQLARDRAAETVRQQVDQQMMYQQLKGELVQWHNGTVDRFDDAALESKKLFLLYFSAHWCAPCRKFTPHLVSYYNDKAPKHPEFELIFISRDKSSFGMETYLREMNMPWPALDYSKINGKAAINRYAGPGIPDLVLVDNSGKVISDSFRGNQYLGPDKVLHDLDAMWSKDPNRVAQSH